MKKQAQGFIFLMTLICTAVISVLIVTSMQHILLYYKAINKKEALHQHFYQLEEVAMQLAQTAFSADTEGCVSKKDSANQAIQKLVHHEGCSLKHGATRYQYLIEDLGEFPCLISFKKGQKKATRHRRVSIIQMEEEFPVSLLQLRFIALGSVANCLETERTVSLGVSSWRYFTSLDQIVDAAN